MAPTKACPVVLRTIDRETQILVFEHPQAGFQLVKGTIEAGERADDAALRELREESGIENATCVEDLGLWHARDRGQIWSFWLCDPRASLPDTWLHEAPDDGGQVFRFFWHPLAAPAISGWHAVYRNALGHLRAVRSDPVFAQTAKRPQK